MTSQWLQMTMQQIMQLNKKLILTANPLKCLQLNLKIMNIGKIENKNFVKKYPKARLICSDGISSL